MSTPDLWSTRAVAEAFGVSPATIQKWREAGCPCERRGRGYVYDRRQVLEWYVAREVERRAGEEPERAAATGVEYTREELRAIAMRRMVEMVKGGDGVALVQAVKLLEEMTARVEEPDEVLEVAFVEIYQDDADRIRPTGRVWGVCDGCDQLVRMQWGDSDAA